MKRNYIINSSMLRLSVGAGLGQSFLTRSVGTKMYASPEQLGGCEYDYKSDVYSLGIILQRVFLPTYTQMETLKMLEQVRAGCIRESLLDYLDILGPVLKKTLDFDAKLRPDLEEVERCLVEQETKLFKELRIKADSSSYKLLQNQAENRLGIGLFSNMLSASIGFEGETGHKPCLLLLWIGEVLVFLAQESKSRLALALHDFTLILHAKRRVIGLKSNVKVNVNLYFPSSEDFQLFVGWAQSCHCLIY